MLFLYTFRRPAGVRAKTARLPNTPQITSFRMPHKRPPYMAALTERCSRRKAGGRHFLQSLRRYMPRSARQCRAAGLLPPRGHCYAMDAENAVNPQLVILSEAKNLTGSALAESVFKRQLRRQQAAALRRKRQGCRVLLKAQQFRGFRHAERAEPFPYKTASADGYANRVILRLPSESLHACHHKKPRGEPKNSPRGAL